MNTHDNDIHTAIMDVITDVWDRAKQIDDAADDVLALIEADRKRKGEVVVTKTPEGEIIAVTRQDDEGKILSVIAEADRKRRGEPTAAEISDVIREITGCPDIKNGEDSLVVALGMLFHRCATTQSSEPDYKQLFEQMCERCDALDAKLAEYSEREPVGYIMPTALKQLKAGGNAIVGGVSQGCDVPLYTAPQPV